MDGVKQIDLGGIEVSAPASWYDITDEVEGENPPYTLAEPEEGVGALQFSSAIHKGGVVPAPSPDDLRNMALDFGKRRSLGDAFDQQIFANGMLRGAGVSYRWEEDFIRVWYVSDGRNLVFITYVCDWVSRDRELSTCGNIVKSLRFGPC